MQRVALTIISMICLAGCSSWQPKPPSLSPTTACWLARGKFSVSEGNQRAHGQFQAQYQPNEQNIWIQNTLGITLARIEITPTEAKLIDQDGLIYTAPNAQALIAKHAGLDLPTDALWYWLQGKPHPNHAHTYHDDPKSNTITLHQQGWTIRLRSFDENTVAEKLSYTDEQHRLVLIVRQWRVCE